MKILLLLGLAFILLLLLLILMSWASLCSNTGLHLDC
jgi:hypothetical protein